MIKNKNCLTRLTDESYYGECYQKKPQQNSPINASEQTFHYAANFNHTAN